MAVNPKSLARGRAGLLALLCLVPAVAAAQVGGPPPELREQLESLRAEKAARTPIQRKISSRLLHEARMRRGLPVTARVPVVRTGVEVAADGSVLVDLRADVTPRLLGEIARLGGRVASQHPEYTAIRARVPLLRLEELAALPEVRSVRPADRAMTRAIDVSEGDAAHRAAELRARLGADGTGIKVGVLSDGVDSLASLQGSGDLPASVTVLPGQAGSGDEGTAMLEIVHDLAPGADLLFATAFAGQAEFASNILALRAAGANVIVDDVAYFAESVFQDDDVAAAVDAVAADGALYFSAAGNEGNWDDGTSGVWEGDANFHGATLGGDPVHDFGGGVLSDAIVADTPFVFALHWSDPNGASANDYDLVMLNRVGNRVVAISDDVQDGSGDPIEIIDSSFFNDRNNRLAIVRTAGADRYLHLDSFGGELAVATPGQTNGHAAARGALGVAAVDVAQAGGGVFPASASVETYSSDGPRRVFYEADGTPITPGDLLATGGELRAKPDLAAADCVSTATPGFGVFCGTSAAAPHAAGVAALLLDLGNGVAITPAAVRDALLAGAIDIEAPGPDRDAGAGIADALAGAYALGIGPCANGIDDDGDGRIDFDLDPAQADPGCKSPYWPKEDPQCQDGVDNDGKPGTDYDGGISVLGAGGADPEGPDPQCVDRPWRDLERPTPSCGLGAELLLALVPLARARRRQGRSRPV